MRSPYQFIIEPLDDKLYNNTKKIGDVDFIISSSFENHKTTNRQAVVKAVPVNYNGPIQDGALIIVHHNVFRKHLDMKGVEQFSKNKLMGNIYTVYDDVIYAYKNDWSQEWSPIEPYCFVTPIKNEEEVKMTADRKLYGTMLYSNQTLIDYGVVNGDIVGFTPDSEYEFDIDNVKMYRINSIDICLKV